MPAARLRLVAIPQPHPATHGLHAQLPLGALTYRDGLPMLGRLSRRPFVHSLAGTLRLQQQWLPAAGRFTLGHKGLRIFQINGLVSVHIGHEHFPVGGQSTQKGWVLAIPAIDPHPTEPHTVLTSLNDHLEGQLRLALEDPLGLRDTRRYASLAILGPLLGKVQTSIDQSRVSPLRQSSKNRHLTVLYFTQ